MWSGWRWWVRHPRTSLRRFGLSSPSLISSKKIFSSHIARLCGPIWSPARSRNIRGPGGRARSEKPWRMGLDLQTCRPRIAVADATPEKLCEILAKQPGGVLQYRDELAGWLNFDRYSGGKGERAFWLEAFG